MLFVLLLLSNGVANQSVQCALIHLGVSLLVRALVLYRCVCKCIDRSINQSIDQSCMHAWHPCMRVKYWLWNDS
jgi:hypothetical protein